MRVQKIEVPESTDPNRKYDPKQAEKAWKDFFQKFPDMTAWEITLKPTVSAWKEAHARGWSLHALEAKPTHK
jgi:hypothetical protein